MGSLFDDIVKILNEIVMERNAILSESALDKDAYLNEKAFQITKLFSKCKLNSKKKKKRKKSTEIYSVDYMNARLIRVWELYKSHGTLEGVAKELHLTRERVRQLLESGEKRGFYKYITHSESTKTELIARISEDDLIRILKSTSKRTRICTELGINQQELYYLSQFYQIDLCDYDTELRNKKYLEKYTEIVEAIGHHPSATELQKRPDWRAVNSAIGRIWGGIKAFRSEYGIPTPDMRISPKTLEAFRDWKIFKKQKKAENKQRVADMLKNNHAYDLWKISNELGISRQTVAKYTNELITDGIVERIGRGNKIKYRLTNTRLF